MTAVERVCVIDRESERDRRRKRKRERREAHLDRSLGLGPKDFCHLRSVKEDMHQEQVQVRVFLLQGTEMFH